MGLIPWSWRISSATKPVVHNYSAQELQLLQPVGPRAHAPQQEKAEHRNWSKPAWSNEDPRADKNKYTNNQIFYISRESWRQVFIF